MKKIALSEVHEKAGAKMVEFAGYYMPLQYEGLKVEHDSVRNNVGIFDVSHMGEFMVSGSGALAFLQKVTSNDVSKLQKGKVQYSCFPNEDGGIVDDLLVYCLEEDHYMLVVNASNIEKDWQWLQKHLEGDVELMDVSEETSLLAVQGPNAARALQALTDIDLAAMKYYTFEIAQFAGVPDVIISATGYTGAGGFEIYFRNVDAEHIWQSIMENGAEFQLKPAGLAARDTLRLEKGFCLYGNDIDENTSPIAAGLGWITKFTKDFINKEELARQKAEGTEYKLVGFMMKGRGIPRKDYIIQNEQGEKIGQVSSGTQSPTLGEAIGMGYVKSEYAAAGTKIMIEIRQKAVEAEVCSLPFVK